MTVPPLPAHRSILCGLALLSLGASLQAQLQLTYSAKAVQTLAFAGTTLEDTRTSGGDTFHIWHMKATDLQGNRLNCAQCGWGENNNGTSWNPATHTETYTFSWGSIATQFVQTGNNLDMIVTETNLPGSNLIFDGAEIYPFALHFPQDPKGFSGYSQFLPTTTGPAVSPADFGSGIVTAVIPNESAPLYGGWKNAGANTYTPLMASTSPDGLANFLPHNDRPVPPGTSFTYTVSLRFTPEGTPASATDAYASFAATYPSQMTWTDKRIIGTAYLASSPPTVNGDQTQPGGFPTNPRRYFNDPSVNITTPSGLRAFQNRVLAQAAVSVTDTQALSGQGVITWDFEGEQYPQQTTYVCSPDQIATVSPEMESLVTDPASAYLGQKLDDAYFKTLSAGGLKIGLCLRPQVFTFGPNGTASQVYLSSNAAIIANLENKARYANSRWGATIFYVDSTVDTTGGTLDPTIFQQLITDLPSLLFIPEESTPRYYAYSAPFYSFIFHTDLGTPAAIYNTYPKAFGANLVNDVDPATLAQYTPQLTQSVVNGDILMGHVDYWQANDPTLLAIYQAAGVTGPVQQLTPALTWPPPSLIAPGTPLSATQLDASANVPGTFTYTPPAGTILPPGSSTLMVTFTPTDTKDYKSATASVPLTVNAPTTPTLSWTTPAPITYGTPLGGTQLNATANVTGSFSYAPPTGTMLRAGNNPLAATFTPADLTHYGTATASTTLTVNPAAPTVTWPTPTAITYGTALSSTQLNATANIPGNFTYTPPSGTVLATGSQPLVTSFTPTDAIDYTTATGQVTLTVNPGPPAPPSKLSILAPTDGSTVSGQIVVYGQCSLTLDPAGTYLIVDGAEWGTHRVTDRPFNYPLDTTLIANGPHTLQLWGHDIGNNTTLSAPVTVVVAN